MTPIENVVFGHYLLKYRLLQMGFSWTEIDNLHTKELDIMIHLYNGISAKEHGFG